MESRFADVIYNTMTHRKITISCLATAAVLVIEALAGAPFSAMMVTLYIGFTYPLVKLTASR
jgi:hypothetical protein